MAITGKKLTGRLTLVLLAVALSIVSVLLWLERRNRFPVVEPGLYAGTITGIFQDESEPPVPLVMQAFEGQDALLVAVLSPESAVKVLVGTKQQGSSESSLPLTFESPNGTLRFMGTRVGERTYAGTAINLDLGKNGRWQVQPVAGGDVSIAPRVQEQIKLWLKLKEELGHTEYEFTELQKQIPAQRAEVEKLSAAISEGSKLKTSAEEKYNAVKNDLEKAQRELAEKQERATKLEEKLKLAQQVTAAGRLVSLVHQTAEREARWIESMLRSGGELPSPEVETALAQGAKVVELQEQIEKEKARINELTVGGQQP
jgi:hypothetical protein